MATIVSIAAVVLLIYAGHGVEGFLSGAPGRDVLKPSSGTKTKTQTDIDPRPVVEDVLETSPLGCEVLYIGDTPVSGSADPVCFDSTLSPEQAREIAVEASSSQTVPKATIDDALQILADLDSPLMSMDGNIAGAASLRDMDGIWRLCFCGSAGFLQGLRLDKHGYVSREQQVHVHFDSRHGMVTLGSSGFDSLPKVIRGSLAYADESRLVTGRFDEGEKGLEEEIVLRACLIDNNTLAFQTVSEGHDGFLLFQCEKSKAAARRLRKREELYDDEIAAAKRAAAAKIAGQNKINMKLIGDEELHESKRMAIQEKGKTTGSFNTFMRYLETEGLSLYAVLAGPTLFTFIRHYMPIATTKSTKAAMLIAEVVRSYLDTA